MLLEEVLIAKLTAPDSKTYALIGNRITPDYIPDGYALPAIYMQRIPKGPNAEYNIDQTIDHIVAVYDLNCIASQNHKLDALALANAVRADLSGYRYADPTITIIMTFWNRQDDMYEGDTKRHKIKVEIEVWYIPK